MVRFQEGGWIEYVKKTTKETERKEQIVRDGHMVKRILVTGTVRKLVPTFVPGISQSHFIS